LEGEEEERLEKVGEQERRDRNTITGKKEKHLYERIYEWAVRLANEEESSEYHYCWFEDNFKLLTRLERTTGNLVSVYGAQGIGKSSLCRALFNALKMIKGRSPVHHQVTKGYEPLGYWEEDWREDTVEGKTYRYKTRSWEWRYEDATDLLVDLWDYSRGSRTDIVKALDAIQEYWRMICSRHKKEKWDLPNIVVFVQKEARKDHFFLGKMETFEIQPIKPKNLVGAYKIFFGSEAPFTEEALHEIAVLSQGIFRRFKKYVATCFDNISIPSFVQDTSKRITKEDVKNWISLDKIMKDMEYELFDLYPRSKEKQKKAVIVLQYLREKGPRDQIELARDFFDTETSGKAGEMACSRMLEKLEAHGYVTRWIEGRKKMVKTI